ncbi:Ger(x)C family spore germination protein [Paenibacillus thalictri]|uniref:Ger(X)C family spore germination protein n=1 Tax=Paenibacillus thalictri TaxID=2527873 RepID=A0A4Q9DXB4_9BACL|nr:Ger(x)C family spore germination protein [Paenibacillus thalictri]TBL80407.1 Ger(x)C family spore germination protein [Paenibacillus thalictri]
MKNWLRLALIPLLFGLTGCWDLHNIENQNYITALGFDYVDNEYIAYGQLLDFSAVAKQESGRPATPATTWVGKGKGKAYNLALNDLYRTSQQRILWSQVTSIMITERALKQGTDNFNDALSRYREFRKTPWIFGTQRDIGELMTTPAFYNLSELDTISHEPTETYRQRAWIEPIRYMYFMGDKQEPGKTVILPSLNINTTHWTRDNKPDPKLIMDGAFLFNDKQFYGRLGDKQLKGLRWMTKSTLRSPIMVEQNNVKVVLSLGKPQHHFKSSLVDGEPKFSLKLELTGNIVEMAEKTDEDGIIKKAEALVKQEILYTYRQGLGIHADIFQLENVFFKEHYKEWKQLNKDKKFELKDSSLASIDVNLRLSHSGLTTR